MRRLQARSTVPLPMGYPLSRTVGSVCALMLPSGIGVLAGVPYPEGSTSQVS